MPNPSPIPSEREELLDRLEQFAERGIPILIRDEWKSDLADLIMAECRAVEADLAVAMAHMQGCGHEYPPLSKKYPQYASKLTGETPK